VSDTAPTFLQKTETLLEALPYIQTFRGEMILVKFGGSAMESAAQMDSILKDVAFMWTVGMHPVVVHGGGKAISRALAAAGLGTQFVQGLRVTDAASMRVVSDVIRNQVNRDVVERLRAFGVAAEPLSGDEVFHVHRKTGTDPATGQALDWGFVGVPDACDTGPVREIVHRGAVPVLCPLGLGDDGSLYNVNADHAAAALAKSLKPRKLAFVSDVPGLLRDPGDPDTLIHTLRASDAPALMESGVVGGGMLPKIQSCLDALRAGVRKVHIVDGRMAHSLLLEIYTQTGVGTEITAQ
jgi:acetylglutamate kinase